MSAAVGGSILAFACMLLYACASVTSAEDALPIPTLRWFENEKELFVRVLIKNPVEDATRIDFTADRFSVKTFGEDGDTLRRQAGATKPVEWDFSLDVREDIVPEKCQFVVKPTDIMLTMTKKHPHSFDRLSYLEAPPGFRGRIKMEQASYDKTNSSAGFVKGGATGKTWSSGDDDDEDTDILDEKQLKWLTDTDFDKTLEKHDTVLADIYFPWCKECKAEKAHYAKLAKKMAKRKKKMDNALFAMVDAREQRGLARRFNITCASKCELLLFKHGEETQRIEAKLSVNQLFDELKPYLGPLIKPLKAKPDAAKFSAQHDMLSVVGLFSDDSSQPYTVFKQLAAEFRKEAVFGALIAANDDSFRTAPPALKLYNAANHKHDGTEAHFDGNFDIETLREFVRIEREPYLQEYSYDAKKKAEDGKKAVGMLFVNHTESSKRKERSKKEKKRDKLQTEPYQNIIRAVSKKHRADMTFLWLSEAEHGYMLEDYGVARSNIPTFVVQHFGRELDDGRGASKYALTTFGTDATTDDTVDGAAAANLEAFVKSVLDGAAPRAFKSQPEPTDLPPPDAMTIRQVVLLSFDNEVRQAPHDVLLATHTAQCDKFKAMRTDLELLITVLGRSDVNAAVFLKEMDSSANDKPDDFSYEQFGDPSYFFVKKGHNRVKFEGEPTAIELLKFMHEHSTSQFDLKLVEEEFNALMLARDTPPAEPGADEPSTDSATPPDGGEAASSETAEEESSSSESEALKDQADPLL